MLVVGTEKRSLSFYSRSCGDHEVVASPLSSPEQFVKEIFELVQRHGIPYVFPVTEGSLRALIPVRTELEKQSKLIAGSPEMLEQGLNKRKMLDLAERIGVTTTRSFYPADLGEAIELANQCGFPVIFKPRGDGQDGFDMKVAYAYSEDDIRRILERVPEGSQLPMMQDYAYGPHTQFCCFVERGKEIHSQFQDDTVRMLPLTGGIGVRRRSRLIVPQIAEESIRLFRAMDWEGPASSRWKGPGPDGRYRFIEVGTRIIASIGSPLASGIDFPWMQYQYFTGQKVTPGSEYLPGQNNRTFRGDTLTVARYVLGDGAKSADQLPSRAKILGDWLLDAVRPGLCSDAESLRDPGPGLIELMSLCRDLGRVLKRRLRDLVRPLVSAARRKRSSAGDQTR